MRLWEMHCLFCLLKPYDRENKRSSNIHFVTKSFFWVIFGMNIYFFSQNSLNDSFTNWTYLVIKFNSLTQWSKHWLTVSYWWIIYFSICFSLKLIICLQKSLWFFMTFMILWKGLVPIHYVFIEMTDTCQKWVTSFTNIVLFCVPQKKERK